jgi:hypothetical protein
MSKVLVAITLLGAMCVAAQEMPGRHPGYYQAISDLIWARAILKAGFDQGAAGEDEQRAVGEITAAMVAIHSADLNNGNNAPGQQNPNLQYPPAERFHRVLELLFKSRKEIGHEEDNPEARRLRNSAWMHIDAAVSNIRDARSYWR